MFTLDEAKLIIEVFDRAPLKGHKERELTNSLMTKLVRGVQEASKPQNVETTNKTSDEASD